MLAIYIISLKYFNGKVASNVPLSYAKIVNRICVWNLDHLVFMCVYVLVCVYVHCT